MDSIDELGSIGCLASFLCRYDRKWSGAMKDNNDNKTCENSWYLQSHGVALVTWNNVENIIKLKESVNGEKNSIVL